MKHFSLIGKIIVLGIVACAAAFFLLHPSPTTFIKDSTSALGIDDMSEPSVLFKDQLYVGQILKNTDDDCLISVPEMAQTVNGKKELTHILTVEDCEYDEDDFVEVVFGGTLADDDKDDTTPLGLIISGAGTGRISNPSPNLKITVNPLPESPIFETLSLKSTRNGQDVLLSYEDTTGNTISVEVTLRNSVGVIFSGEFKSSKFEALVNDVTEDTPHIIEMTIEHAKHGTIFSSAYNPSGSEDKEINGVFTQPPT